MLLLLLVGICSAGGDGFDGGAAAAAAAASTEAAEPYLVGYRSVASTIGPAVLERVTVQQPAAAAAMAAASAAGSSRQQPWEKLLAAAVEAERGGHFHDALSVYRTMFSNGHIQASMGEPGNYRHRLGLGRTLLKMRVLHHAVLMFEEASSLQTDAHEAHFWLGMARSKQGRLDEAIVHYKNCLFFVPAHLDALHNLGSLLLMKGRLNEGLHYYRAAVRTYRAVKRRRGQRKRRRGHKRQEAAAATAPPQRQERERNRAAAALLQAADSETGEDGSAVEVAEEEEEEEEEGGADEDDGEEEQDAEIDGLSSWDSNQVYHHFIQTVFRCFTVPPLAALSPAASSRKAMTAKAAKGKGVLAGQGGEDDAEAEAEDEAEEGQEDEAAAAAAAAALGRAGHVHDAAMYAVLHAFLTLPHESQFDGRMLFDFGTSLQQLGLQAEGRALMERGLAAAVKERYLFTFTMRVTLALQLPLVSADVAAPY